ncbi:unnamed protein product [Gemmata massiliana]|uniref:Lipoprotein SmpA/OmlA domain-containing protein n=1 Tax=Gemmata massiliana TaxID=1210884 RepID=A0A6P2CUB6_9BACT|nr:hypothetical protein [Gemmata massiliana]VTR92147.1 unnamed protein product [Gemmata massiliana]
MRSVWCGLLVVLVLGCSRNGDPAPKQYMVKDAQKDKKVYSREDFDRLVVGKSREDVVSAAGTPDSVVEKGGETIWHYKGITRDTATNTIDDTTQVILEGGLVVRIVHQN